MPKPQSFRRIIIEDFPEKERPLISKLAYCLNPFAEDVLQCLNNNLSIKDNLELEQRTFSVTVASGVPTGVLTIKTGLTSNCAGTQVIKAVNKTNSSHVPTSVPFITFSNDAGNIIISNISGLQDNEKYDLTVVFYPA